MMKRAHCWKVRAVVAAVLMAVLVGVWWLTGDDPLLRNDAIKTTLAWGRLATLPPSSRDVQIKTQGGPFDRSFLISFVAPPDEIQAWLRRSPGTAGVSASRPDPLSFRHFSGAIEATSQRYLIEPGEGASYAEVLVDAVRNRVQIYVAWS